MAYSLVKLYPKSSFHIGEKGVGLEETSTIIHSDNLFSAICNTFRLLYGKDELEEMLKTFHNNPPFLISSAFYFVDSTLVFPLPLSIDWKNSTEDFDILKKLKNVRFISERIFREVIENETLIENYIANLDKSIIQGVLFSSEENIQGKKIYRILETPRVVLDRKTHASNIYHIAEVSFSERCGLYFLIDYKNEKIKPKIEASIRLLGDEGIGGEKTSGKGFFEPCFETIQLKNTDNDKNVTLSLVYPEKEELSSIRNGSYEFLKRGGWVFSQEHKNLRKRTVRMLSEGSVFSGKVTGKLVNVTPNVETEHEIYRYGYAFTVPCG